MIKRILLSLPLHVKVLFFTALVLSSSWMMLSSFSEQLLVIIGGIGNTQNDVFLKAFHTELSRFYIAVISPTLIFFWLFYLDVYHYLKHLNQQLVKAISDKKLKITFSNRLSKDILGKITRHSNQLLDMFRHFDELKSARVTLEVNTNRQLMNTISEGIIFLDPDKVITHLNHHAEKFLGFAPGETVGQVIVRYINDETFCDVIEMALSDHKTVAKDIIIYEKPYKISSIPIKNRKGQLLRVLISLCPR